ncbi:MAG TPA: aminoglycoside phosphotransferase family protein [Caulobacteraceae bacterium]|jgi:aminoglycoside phosphotransferase (APT) family kinase protein|nr:aminoglycoside phosphotransferase family protein [Caulobacteraceae bacterium]
MRALTAAAIDEPLVRRLLQAQFPHWAELPLRPVDFQGWDNRTFRLGEAMSVRLPSAERYALQAGKEARWLPHLAAALPLAIPQVLGVGQPTAAFPYPWSVRGWIDGRPAGPADAGSHSVATDLAAFLQALWRIDPAGGPQPGPHCFWRGGALHTYDSEARAALTALSGQFDLDRTMTMWEAALASRFDGPTAWVHGDIAPGNLLFDAERLIGVIDFGCCAIGDPACDLAVAWAWLEGPARAAFRSVLAAPSPVWARARGWALWKAAITLADPARGGWPPPALAARAMQALLTEELE